MISDVSQTNAIHTSPKPVDMGPKTGFTLMRLRFPVQTNQKRADFFFFFLPNVHQHTAQIRTSAIKNNDKPVHMR